MFGGPRLVAVQPLSAKISPNHQLMASRISRICQPKKTCHKQDVHEQAQFHLDSLLEELVMDWDLSPLLLPRLPDHPHRQVLLKAHLQISARLVILL
jgi:hypothetical protein